MNQIRDTQDNILRTLHRLEQLCNRLEAEQQKTTQTLAELFRTQHDRNTFTATHENIHVVGDSLVSPEPKQQNHDFLSHPEDALPALPRRFVTFHTPTLTACSSQESDLTLAPPDMMRELTNIATAELQQFVDNSSSTPRIAAQSMTTHIQERSTHTSILTQEFLPLTTFSLTTDVERPLSMGNDAYGEIFADKKSIHEFTCAQAFFLWYDREIYNFTQVNRSSKNNFYRYHKLITYLKLFLPPHTEISRCELDETHCTKREEWREHILSLAETAEQAVIVFMTTHLTYLSSDSAVSVKNENNDDAAEDGREIAKRQKISRSFSSSSAAPPLPVTLRKGFVINAGTTVRRLMEMEKKLFPSPHGVVDQCKSNFPRLEKFTQFHT